MTKPWCSPLPTGLGVRLAVQIMPNAKKSEVIGIVDDALKIRLQAQPIDGKANQALIRYLADTLKVPKSAIQITHGHTNKRKLIEIATRGLALEDVMQALGGAPNPDLDR